MWSGNWIAGRALRDAFDPVSLNFFRWAVATLILAPFALPLIAGKGPLLRRHAGLLLVLAFTGVALFQSLVYLGLRSTTAINAVLINSSAPLFILLCSWALERERPTLRQVAGMLISLGGILVILSRGEAANLLELQFHAGDAWIVLAMPVWGLYSVLLKRRPAELGGTALLFVISVLGLAMLAPPFLIGAAVHPLHWPSAPQAAGVLYMGLAASVIAFIFWNRGVAVVGANAAGFTLHFLPAFGTLLAIIFLGESLQLFHGAGIATILAGVILATRSATEQPRTVVLSSLALKGVLEKFHPEFERIVGRLELRFDATQAILVRLAQGERADLLVLAADAMEELRKRGEVTEVRALGSSGVGLAVRAGAPKPGIGSVDALVHALVSAGSVAHSKVGASGIYFSELLERLGIAGRLKKRLVIEKGPVGLAVAAGEAEIGVQQLCELAPVPGIEILGPLPEPLQKLTHFSAGIQADASNPKAALALMELLGSEAARAAMIESGMQPHSFSEAIPSGAGRPRSS